jgi:hypothetical protein
MRTLVLLSIITFLTACGGGGSSVPSTPSVIPNVVSQTTNLTQTLAYKNVDKVGGLFNTAVADLNGDGLEDVVISEWPGEPSTTVPNPVYNKIPVKLLLQQSDGTLKDSSSMLGDNLIDGTQRIILADFDGDGKIDIFLPGFQDSCCYNNIIVNSVLFWNNGTEFTRFDFATTNPSPGVCIGDLNNDGYLDIVTTSATYINNQRSQPRTFITTTLNIPGGPDAGASCTIFKNGSHSFIATGNNGGVAGYNAAIYELDGNLNYIGGSGLPSFEGGIGSSDPNIFIPIDLNGDGILDMVVTDNATDSHNGKYHALINNGNFSFADATAQYFPNQINNHTFSFMYRQITVGGHAAIFVPDADSNFIFSTQTNVLQLVNGAFISYEASRVSNAIGSYNFPTLYQRTGGLSILETIPIGLNTDQTNIFYTIGI